MKRNSDWKKVVVIVLSIIGAITALFALLKKRKEYRDIIEYDHLTGLISERKFIEEANKLLEDNPREKYTIISVDIDNFKYINDMYGYEVGTEIIKKFSRYLQGFMGRPLLMTRRFSDNFLIMERTADAKKKLVKAADSGEDVNRNLDEILGESYNFSFSIGRYDVGNRHNNLNYMVDCANYARVQGKQTIGLTFTPFTESMREERERNNRIIATMDKALENGDFVLFYQPKVDMVTEKICGAEALIRWKRDGKIVAPDEFIPVFEKNGFIEKIDYYVVEQVCQFIRENEAYHLPVLSINLSGITVINDDVVENIMKIVQQYKIKPSQLDLEITESAFVGNLYKVVDKIKELRTKWFKISMDDFGSGISSFNRLKSIPLDILKIDREFIIDSIENDKGGAIIKNILNMATDLGLESVAEGIETKEQCKFLQELGCNVGQGYYFARPLPPEEFLAKIKEQNEKDLV
ncbi:MAG: bifunctional diguanylate cyclase/phosphodiesterase [Eubacteriales bacterium]